MVGMVALLVSACGSGASGGTASPAPTEDDDTRAVSGQTGSVACEENISAACSTLAGHAIVEVEVLEGDSASQWGTFKIVGVVNPSPSLNADDVGRTLKGPYGFFPFPDAKKKPGDWTLDTSSRLVAGDLVLVTFWQLEYREAHCPGFTECLTPCYGQTTDYAVVEACSDECAEACVPNRSAAPWVTSLWVFPRAESYDFAGEMVAFSELAALTDRNHCREVFPLPPAPPCNDSGPTE
jgi:hypothetical protein